MCMPKAPEPPDPKETAGAQTSTNVSTATANAFLGNVNQKTPYGNLTYTQSGQQFIADPNGSQWYKKPDGTYTQSLPPAKAAAAGPAPSAAPATPGVSAPNVGSSDDFRSAGGGGTSPGTVPPVPAAGSAASTMPKGWESVTGYYVPQFTAETTLSPDQQRILDLNNSTGINLATLARDQSGRLGNLLSSPMDLSGLPAGGSVGNIRSPQYTQYGAGPNLQASFGDAGPVQRGLGDAGDITREFGDAGELTRTYNTDFSADRQKVEDALMQRMNPQLTRDKQALESRLVEQGIRIGSDAYHSAMNDFDRQSNDARLGAILNAGQEQSRLVGLERDRAAFENSAQGQAFQQLMARAQFGNSAQAQAFQELLTRGQFGNSAQQQEFDQNAYRTGFSNDVMQQMHANDSARISGNNALEDSRLNADLARFNAQNTERDRALSERYQERNQPLNEIIGLMSGSPVQNPSFVNTQMPSIPTVDYAGLVNENYNQRLGAWQQQAASRNGLFSGLLGLGANLIRSDRRLKRDIHRIGAFANGLPKYVYRYLWGDDYHVGVMSDDVRKVRPDAVMTIDGYDAVDYRRALA